MRNAAQIRSFICRRSSNWRSGAVLTETRITTASLLWPLIPMHSIGVLFATEDLFSTRAALERHVRAEIDHEGVARRIEDARVYILFDATWIDDHLKART